MRLPQVRAARQHGQRQPAPGAQDRALQDPLGLCEERRSDAEAANILNEALQLLRTRRKTGEIIF